MPIVALSGPMGDARSHVCNWELVNPLPQAALPSVTWPAVVLRHSVTPESATVPGAGKTTVQNAAAFWKCPGEGSVTFAVSAVTVQVKLLLTCCPPPEA